MERLTEKHYKKNGGYFMKCSELCEREETMCMECERSNEVVDRLGAIEDILGDDYDLDRLRELVEADRDGRCVVYQKKYPVISYYYKEDDRYIREVTGVVSKEEYEAALKTDNKKTYRWEQGDMYDFGDVCPVCGWDSGQEPCNLTECPNCGATMDTQTIL